LGTHPDIKLNTLERWLEHLAMRGFEFMSVANLASTVLNTSVLNIIQYTVDSSAKRINLTAKPGFKLDTLEVFESPMSVCEYSVSVS
jgi:acetolactate synthase regulatory subunit